MTQLPVVRDDQWLTPKAVGVAFGVDADTVLRWWHQGLPTGRDIPQPYMRRLGFSRYLFHPALISFIQAEQARLD